MEILVEEIKQRSKPQSLFSLLGVGLFDDLGFSLSYFIHLPQKNQCFDISFCSERTEEICKKSGANINCGVDRNGGKDWKEDRNEICSSWSSLLPTVLCRDMNLPVKFAERLPIFSIASQRSPSLRGIPKLGLFHSLRQIRGFVASVHKEMAGSLKRCDLGSDNNIALKVLLPATEAHTEEAIRAIQQGKVIAVPTDTLYGFACDACSAEAVHRIYEIKGRKQTSPLAICVGDVLDIERFAVTNHLPCGLLDSLLPGPVTVVLMRGESSILEKSLNPGLDSIGVRVPDSDFIRVISRGSGSALALTSANLSGQPSSVCIKDFENLWEHCEYIYDGGLLPSGRAGSTVVDLTKLGKYKILRPGSAREETVAILQRYSLQEDVK